MHGVAPPGREVASFDAHRWDLFVKSWFWLGHAFAGNIESPVIDAPASAYLRAKSVRRPPMPKYVVAKSTGRRLDA